MFIIFSGMVIDLRDLQYAKALLPILVTVSGIITEVNLALKKAPS